MARKGSRSTATAPLHRARRTAANGAATPTLPLDNDNGTTEPTAVDWHKVARTLLLSRALDAIEETRLVPGGLVTYQFSARGHDLAQIILAQFVDRPHDAATVYYRSRPFVLAQGLTAEEALRSTMGRAGGISEGRDIGVVHNLPSRGRANVLPTSGDVGAQYTPAVGWAQAARYRAEVLEESDWSGAMAVALGGDASCATNGFWSALNIVTVERLPYLFFIEDNGYGISVPGTTQTPGANIAANLASFGGLRILDGDGTEPDTVASLVADAVGTIRAGDGPVLLRLRIPRLCGHSSADNQSYKSRELVEEELACDPLPKLRDFMVASGRVTAEEWSALEAAALEEAERAATAATEAPHPDPSTAVDGVLSNGRIQKVGGLRAEVTPEQFAEHGRGEEVTAAGGGRSNLIDAVRTTLGVEMERDRRIIMFGEDVGVKGGVHGATVDMQRRFGTRRVFDTSLNEEGIIGRAVGMAMAGLMPVPEIQFRKYADPAHEQITDCGTIRWRTAGAFAAPLVVRIPVGFGKKTGDPWHSVSGEALYAHLIGWRIAYPSNAEDAAGLLRSALRGDDPTFFFEHRALLDTREGRRSYPGDNYVLPFGSAKVVRSGSTLTIVAWGEMVHRALAAAERSGADVEVIDLRTIVPWDRETVLKSVRRTGRCMVVHEDNWTCGFGGEIAATVAQECFRWLDAPVERLATPDCPIPYNPGLMEVVVPSVERITEAIERTIRF